MMSARVVNKSSKSDSEGSDDIHNRSFFPLPENFSEYFDVPLDQLHGPKKVLIGLDLLRGLIGLAAAGATYDPSFYAAKYQDLRDAHEDGAIEDLYIHYVTQGYFERRVACKEQAFAVDEDWYLLTYPDVADAIKAGTVDSATDHYLTTGRKEGRLPSATVSRPVQQIIASLKTA